MANSRGLWYNMPIIQLEKDIQKSIFRYFKKIKIFYWRNNSGVFVVRDGFGGQRIIRAGALGMPDIFVCLNVRGLGIIIGLEVKTKKGRQSINQIYFQKHTPI